MLDEDRLFPAETGLRQIARDLYHHVRDLPLICPHGHTDPRWYAENTAFPSPSQLFVTPDHYVFRMLCSQGVDLSELGVPRRDGGWTESDDRTIWRRFAEHFHLFRGTPSGLWLEHAFEKQFGVSERLNTQTADLIYDRIADCLAQPEFRPRALYESFGIEVISTTDSALDDLHWHQKLRDEGWSGRVLPAYRPDNVVDPEAEEFVTNIEKLGDITGCDIADFDGYLEAHRKRRIFFREMGATSTDHGHPNAQTANLPQAEAARLYQRAIQGKCTVDEAEQFRAHMLTEMARMSLDDGLVMQLHCGSWRNHSPEIMKKYGADKGFDIPRQIDFVAALKPLLDAVGLQRDLTLIVFTLDETSYTRELAPLAGVYPALRIGPAWWFNDSFEGMRRYRELTTETAGFYNTVGFNDDTRAFCSIPARHDVARRCDCAFLAELVGSGRLHAEDAPDLAYDLAYGLAKRNYKL